MAALVPAHPGVVSVCPGRSQLFFFKNWFALEQVSRTIPTLRLSSTLEQWSSRANVCFATLELCCSIAVEAQSRIVYSMALSLRCSDVRRPLPLVDHVPPALVTTDIFALGACR